MEIGGKKTKKNRKVGVMNIGNISKRISASVKSDLAKHRKSLKQVTGPKELAPKPKEATKYQSGRLEG